MFNRILEQKTFIKRLAGSFSYYFKILKHKPPSMVMPLTLVE